VIHSAQVSSSKQISLVMSFFGSTVNKGRYKPTAIGEVDALSDLYLSIEAVSDDPPRTIEVTI
jgi:hypothetical protein